MLNLTSDLRHKLRLVKRLIPVGLVLIVIAYELIPSRWIYSNFGFNAHLAGEILIFGTIGPALAFLVLELLSRWIEEKETVDVQATLLNKAKEKELEVRQISDDTLQVLFASSLLMTIIKSNKTIPPNITAQIEVTEKALDESIDKLRVHLLDQ